jgi:hypothetical protein
VRFGIPESTENGEAARRVISPFQAKRSFDFLSITRRPGLSGEMQLD